MDGDVEIPIPDGCDFTTRWREALVLGQPQVAVVQIGMWDVVDRILPDGGEPVHLGDPAYEAFLEDEVNAATDYLLKVADRVVWVLQPAPIASTRLPEDPAPTAVPVLNRRLVDWLGQHPDVAFVDLAGWLEATGQATSTDLRPDGTHYSSQTSATAASWLAPAILEAATDGGIVRAGDVEIVPAS